MAINVHLSEKRNTLNSIEFYNIGWGDPTEYHAQSIFSSDIETIAIIQ